MCIRDRLQAIIGIVVPLAGATLPALVVNGISNDMCYSIILKIAIVLGLLLICNITMTYICLLYTSGYSLPFIFNLIPHN